MGNLSLCALPNPITCPSLCPRRLTHVDYMAQIPLVTDVQMGLATGASLADDMRAGGNAGQGVSFLLPSSFGTLSLEVAASFHNDSDWGNTCTPCPSRPRDRKGCLLFLVPGGLTVFCLLLQTCPHLCGHLWH